MHWRCRDDKYRLPSSDDKIYLQYYTDFMVILMLAGLAAWFEKILVCTVKFILIRIVCTVSDPSIICFKGRSSKSFSNMDSN